MSRLRCGTVRLGPGASLAQGSITIAAGTRLKPGPIATGSDGSLWVGGIDTLLRYR